MNDLQNSGLQNSGLQNSDLQNSGLQNGEQNSHIHDDLMPDNSTPADSVIQPDNAVQEDGVEDHSMFQDKSLTDIVSEESVFEENSLLDEVEFDTSNPEPRCPCVLLLDTSGSMYGRPIEELNNGLAAFQKSLQHDDLAAMRVEVAIVTFGGDVEVAQDFVSAHEFQAPRLSVSGQTPMGAAVEQALDMIQQRKAVYKQNGVPYYRPWIFLLTDGAPTDGWQNAAQRIQEEESRKSVAFFAVGVYGADMDTLGQIATRQPVGLKGLHFREMFEWLSVSLTSVSHSQVDEQVPLESPIGWAEV